MSTGLLWLQCAGSIWLSAARVWGANSASVPPPPIKASVASTPGPPALVRMVRRGPRGPYRYRFFTFEHGNEPALDVWPVVGALSPLKFWWAFSCCFLVFVEESSPLARRRCARCLARRAGLETAWPAGGDG